jgi:hypothetical protein
MSNTLSGECTPTAFLENGARIVTSSPSATRAAALTYATCNGFQVRTFAPADLRSCYPNCYEPHPDEEGDANGNSVTRFLMGHCRYLTPYGE